MDSDRQHGRPRRRALISGLTAIMLVLAAAIIAGGIGSAESQDKEMKYNELTAEEERVILHKGTEIAFTGEFYNHKEKGTYVCRRCDAPLYRSEDKFDSQCGWPSFDDEIPGAVRREPDADGRRTEILCNNCGGHLGHVFEGEGFTDKNVRHCVNSISMKFVAAGSISDSATAYFAGGCFWGVEYYYEREPGVLSARVGYMGGHKDNPTYREVCSGTTGHAEVMEVRFDPSQTTYEKLAKLFFEIHDPTQVNRQGPDVGSQYRSAIFYTDEHQKETAERLIALLTDKGLSVATELAPADEFWVAEDYHQDYYDNKGGQPYCHFRTARF